MSDPARAMFTTSAMDAVFSAESHVRSILAFEAALALAEADAGVIPNEATDAIVAACQVELFDVDAIYHDAATAGTVAIPLVRALTRNVGPSVARFVHWGATSQDAIDSAFMLQMRDGLSLLDADLLALGAACANLVSQHRRTLMAGRTVLQHAVPVTFGLKVARWLGLAIRVMRELRDRRRSALALQFGGAAGTLAALGESGDTVAESLASRLGLTMAELPWHAERDRPAAVASALGLLAGAMSKIATDIVLLAQTEVGEVVEGAGEGKGVSSAMPHKRNPVDATMAIASARLAIGQVPVVLGAMSQEHERAAGAWQAEWVAMPDLFRYAAGAVARVRNAVEGLEVDADRMLANLQAGGGAVMSESLTIALARKLGRPAAQALVSDVIASGAPSAGLRGLALGDARISAVLSADDIERALEPSSYLGVTNTLIDRALATWQELLALPVAP